MHEKKWPQRSMYSTEEYKNAFVGRVLLFEGSSNMQRCIMEISSCAQLYIMTSNFVCCLFILWELFMYISVKNWPSSTFMCRHFMHPIYFILGNFQLHFFYEWYYTNCYSNKKLFTIPHYPTLTLLLPITQQHRSWWFPRSPSPKNKQIKEVFLL